MNVPSPFSPEFWKKLEDQYRESTHSDEAYQHERPILVQVLVSLQESLSPRYEINAPLGVGGVGIVLQVRDLNLGIPCALKFPRPTAGREQLFAEILESETAHLLIARHPNITQIYYHDVIKALDMTWPYYVMEFIPGGQDALKFFEMEPRPAHVILNIMKQVIDGLIHLHSLAIVHCDIKLENVLVAADGRTVLSDLGSARHLHEGPAEILVIFSRAYAHPKLISLAVAATPTDPNRVKVPIKRSDLCMQFDLYALGKNVKRLLSLHDRQLWDKLDAYTRKYLDLAASRLLDGKNTESECALGLPKAAFEEIKYGDCSDVAIDLRKITGEYNLYKTIPELNPFPVKTVQASSTWPTPFTSRLAHVVEHPVMRRLAGVSQLGLIALIYPTATHSRLEHVLGTFSNVARYCDALYHDPVNPLFCQIMTEADVKAVLLAALLHDVGHYPLAHDLEDFDPTLFSHEALGKELFQEDIGKRLGMASLKTTIEQEWNVSVEHVLDIIDVDPTDLTKPFKDRILHTILDGPIDADKLDYLVRDSTNLNLPFGRAIDATRLLQCLTVIFSDEGGKVYGAIGIHEKGRIPADSVAFARYALFGTVYWHHTSRAAKAMLRRALSQKISDGHHFREEFRDTVLGLKVETQASLFRHSDHADHEASQVLPGDRELLVWLADRTSSVGTALIKMLLRRNIYRRLSVISAGRNKVLWETLVKFGEKFGPRGIFALEQYMQDSIIELIRNIDPGRRTTSVLEPAATDLVIEMHVQGTPLVLIDIPTRRPGTLIPLEYLPEADRYEALQEWQEPLGLEDSLVWRDLYDHFLEVVGKVRVFGHPGPTVDPYSPECSTQSAVFKTLKAAVRKEDIERIMKTAVRTLSKRLSTS